MATAKATLSNHRQSPRKVRLMADLIRGKKVADAMALLSFANKKSAGPVKKLIQSAVANAKNIGLDDANLVVKAIDVNPGKIMYRRLSMSRGRAFPMRKRTSHIDVVLADKLGEVEVIKTEKEVKVETKAIAQPVKKSPKTQTVSEQTKKKVVAKK